MHKLGFALLGFLGGALTAVVLTSFYFLPSDPSFDLSSLIVRGFANPESESMQIVVGCLSNYNGRSGGDNARLAAQRRTELRIEHGAFIPAGTPRDQRPSMIDSLNELPGTDRLRSIIDAELREEFGCVVTLANRPM